MRASIIVLPDNKNNVTAILGPFSEDDVPGIVQQIKSKRESVNHYTKTDPIEIKKLCSLKEYLETLV